MVFAASDLKHVLSRILILSARSCAVVGEVVQEGARVWSDVSEVNSLTTLAKEEKSVELLEQNGRGLMDGTENSLAVISQLAKECANSPRALRVETTSRLVKEQKKLRLRGEFDTNREKLALFDVQTLAGNTNNSFGEVFHVEHLDNILDIVVFLLLAHVLRLSQHS